MPTHPLAPAWRAHAQRQCADVPAGRHGFSLFTVAQRGQGHFFARVETSIHFDEVTASANS